MKRQKNHLSLYGIGPIYGALVIAITLAGLVCGKLPALSFGKLSCTKIPLAVIGVIFILLGVLMWVQAVFVSKLDNGIKNNRLVKSGIYSHVRNPIYSAIMFICYGVLLIAGNIIFIPLFFVFWLLLSVLVKHTEEKWLLDLYGEEYLEYCNKVNRAIPSLMKKS